VKDLHDRIQLRCAVYNKNGFGIEISSMVHPNGEVTGTLGWYVPGRLQQWAYPRLFKYPRGEFFGELESEPQAPTLRHAYVEEAKYTPTEGSKLSGGP
jgi:hypothetical protein